MDAIECVVHITSTNPNSYCSALDLDNGQNMHFEIPYSPFFGYIVAVAYAICSLAPSVKVL